MKDFHAEPFDEGTKRKLEVFRAYVREWLPVFLSANKGFSNVAVYDFFAGPGRDVTGVPGSPLITMEEIKRCSSKLHAANVTVRVYLNDDDPGVYASLVRAVEAEGTDGLFSVTKENKDFSVALREQLPAINAPHTANLIIMDQFGVKHVTPEVFAQLAACRATDVLFFISSAIIKRFAGTSAISRYFPGMEKDKIGGLDGSHIHRFVCDYYRRIAPTTKEYFLAPFSIKKDANVYGIIFGSGNLRGLEKFLNVCWKADPKTGEATFNIDDDVAWEGQTLFRETDVIRKQDDFRNRLVLELKKKSLTNRSLYRYCLENGFLPKHVKQLLTDLRDEGVLAIDPPNARGFYIGWDYYIGRKPNVVSFVIKE